jgi:two-component system, NtrC family, sensor histidine kinase HydH
MTQREHEKFRWMDLIWLVFLGGLAVLPPIDEIHKQLILAAIAALQLSERWLISSVPKRGRAYVVLLKILLATLLLDHTGDVGINSSYYPIYYLCVVTAAVYYGPIGTLLWTALASAAYCSYLPLALQEFDLTPSGITELTLRIVFFFIAAILVNNFVMENRQQTRRYQLLAEELEQTNRRLEHIQAEARRSERLAALGQLSAGLAHEIRNPLGVIKGSAEMLNQKLEASNPLASELAGYISTEVNRLSALVTRFLDFARPQHLDRTRQPVDKIVERALKAVASQWTGPAIRVEREYAAGLPDVPLDENFAEQVFINLAQNAYDAMVDGGTLRVTIAAVQRDRSDGVEVRFADNGPGVPMEMREQIFNPFVTTKQKGVGLGLSIVSKIVDDHGGVLHLEAGGGPGACFTVFFPLDEAGTTTRAAESSLSA